MPTTKLTAPTTTIMVVPTTTQPPTAVCNTGWSDWINKDTPDTGKGDLEKMTSSELTSFCPGGMVTKVDCQTVDGIEYFSSGEILTCTTDGGLECNNADNDPIPCSDYKIRYECTCPVVMPTTTAYVPPTTIKVVTTTTQPPTAVCKSGLSGWINKDSPDTGDGDHEQMTLAEIASFCPGGTISKIDCQTMDGIEYYSSGEILTCTTEGGLTCNNADNDPIPCSDYKIQYECTCSPNNQGPAATTVAPATTTTAAAKPPAATTPAPAQPCVGGWSAWINKDTPDAGNGDHEQMTSSELTSFCPGGTISKIDCQTVDGIEYYSSGEILTCTTEGGLTCNNVDNDPIPCSDYKIRYECSCPPIVNNDQEPTVKPREPTATCGWTSWMSGHKPSAAGETETVTALRKTEEFCASQDITAIECTPVSGQQPDQRVQAAVTCDLRYEGLVCRHDDLPDDVTCPDYQVRFLCEPRGQDCSGQVPTAGPQQRPVVTVRPPPSLPETCVVDMGMQNGFIRDDMISASSTRDVSHVSQGARLDSHISWLPTRDDTHQFVQVDFLVPRYVTGVTTQGRGDAPSYVTGYRVLYSLDGREWNVYREERDVDKVFVGNSDPITPVQNMFNQPIRARYVRINPVTWEGRIALRFELQGCFEAYPTGVAPTAIPTASPRATPKPVPAELEGCVEWDQWLDLHQPGLMVRDDVTPMNLLQAASPYCRDPVLIQCRTATPDKTPSELSGQPVRCNLWDGLVCKAEDVEGSSCFNYEVRLGCLKQTAQCLTNAPTAIPTAQPGATPVPVCYPSVDRTSCPASCPAGQYCDGARCVPRSECPCLLDNKVIRARDVTTNGQCETCQCLNGEVRCVPKTCSSCSRGVGHLNRTTCNCDCLTCKVGEFQCSTGSCIPQSSRCNGVIDCQNDELDCVVQATFVPPTAAPTAEPHIHPGHRRIVTPPPPPECYGKTCPEMKDIVCPAGSQLVEIMEPCNCTKKACMTTVKPVCRYTHSVTVSNGLDDGQTTPMDVVYQPGESWRDGLCKTCSCMVSGDGSVSVSCQQQRCPACQAGEEAVTESDDCCGRCRPVGCMVNATLYKDGEVIPTASSCYSKTCVRDAHHNTFYVRELQRQCPRLDTLPTCLHDSDRYDGAGCCMTCVPKTMLKTNSSDCGGCSPRPVFTILRDSVGHFTVHNPQGSPCRNTHPLPDLTQCGGQCGSHSSYRDLIGGFQATCSCCQPTGVSQRHVTLTCDDGSSLEHSYTVPDACQCGACNGGQ